MLTGIKTASKKVHKEEKAKYNVLYHTKNYPLGEESIHSDVMDVGEKGRVSVKVNTGKWAPSFPPRAQSHLHSALVLSTARHVCTAADARARGSGSIPGISSSLRANRGMALEELLPLNPATLVVGHGAGADRCSEGGWSCSLPSSTICA